MPIQTEGDASMRTATSDREPLRELDPQTMRWQHDRLGIVFAWDRAFGQRIHGPGDRPSDWRFKARGSPFAMDAAVFTYTRICVTSELSTQSESMYPPESKGKSC